ncbi:SMI1 / KNR4 family protein (plasmid) [Pseudoalteromonas sp. THAF3]|uniref:SMI1/KNR4 family protein n=1 Tax=Pseudoalteromonas sp. THAF3 TaxID=2587843 RepID=UPI00126903C1|nr:SMI1/KNR4 family protein [Pseudoalteromonas sp. THAF3]QFU06558.1 SMI1 / KNR4 family protein [Pseudoalteromonas sp. THAF3]
MLKEIEDIVEKAKNKKNFTQGDGASSKEISDLESDLAITLPDDYKEFLMHIGYCFWFGGVACGLVGENKRYEKLCSVMIKNSYYREFYGQDDSYSPVPEEGLVIGKWSGGGYYFLFSEESQRSGEVGLFLTETYGQEVSKFKSFTDYFSFLVTGSPDPEPVDVDYDKLIDIIEG